jgi:hypothetical protein
MSVFVKLRRSTRYSKERQVWAGRVVYAIELRTGREAAFDMA